jgi:cytochrome c
MRQFYYGIFAAVILISSAVSSSAQNTLTAKEKKDGWQLLFDGKTTSGWKSWKSDKVNDRWKIANGELYLDKAAADKGDLVTEKEYKDYELALEWKIGACGNSGILFNVIADDKYQNTYHTGPEMQVLDNTCHPDAKIIKHRAGDLYDLISCSKETVKPAGEWNQVRIISKNAKMEFWLNGTKVVEFTMHTPEWDQMVANSKFKTMPDFGKALQGHIALQDHGDPVWFRNIKIRELK